MCPELCSENERVPHDAISTGGKKGIVTYIVNCSSLYKLRGNMVLHLKICNKSNDSICMKGYHWLERLFLFSTKVHLQGRGKCHQSRHCFCEQKKKKVKSMFWIHWHHYQSAHVYCVSSTHMCYKCARIVFIAADLVVTLWS